MADKVKGFNKLLTVLDLAKIIGTKKRHILQMVADQTFPPPIKIGEHERWHPDDFRRWMLSATGLVCRLALPPLEYGEVPSSIQALAPGVLELNNLGDAPCVYFLTTHSGTVVYVGQTTTLLLRIYQHRSGTSGTPKKEFDRVFYLHVPVEELLVVEARFIKLLSPFYNKAGIEPQA